MRPAPGATAHTRRTHPSTRPGKPVRSTPLSAMSALGAALLVAALAVAGIVGLSAPASAAAKVSVSGTPSVDGESQLSLSGSGYQSVQGGFGGIYVLFGWADDSGSWRPSNGGKTGEDYRYVYDDESNPTGYQLFVTFPGSSTASAANGGELASDGTWSGTIRIPGARFTTYDRAQNETTVDCTEVQCGIITIGAHGVANAGNETFTPLDFPAAAGSSDSDDGSASDGDGTAAEVPAASDDSPAAASGDSSDSAGAGDAGDAGGTADSADSAGTAPAASGTVVDPQLVADQQRQQTLLTLLVAVGIVLGLCVMALSFGVGGYLAMKALLLGVNPEALEKVRRKREERAVRAEHKRRRRVSALRRREEIRSQRSEARNDGRTDRAAMESRNSGATARGAHSSRGSAAGATVAGTSGSREAPPWGGPALLQFFEDDGQAALAQKGRKAQNVQKQNASTIVLDRVDELDHRDDFDRVADREETS
ncbi:hypothetical protein [Brevibacterium yomogidense]|uniref:hypothetical protein n=1 Tax=Brevibacterium yomogidense TaxID=946573 RepID=UPI0018E02828|nr:hypothetical protein [Brevibacterium yomogidense]